MPPQLRILVVEDDALVGLLLSEMLEAMGHAVCAVASSEDGALASAARTNPGMLIVDARLHEGSGLSAVDSILREGHVPHFFVTGDIRGILDIRPGAVVIEKPFTEAMLAEAIQRARSASPVA